MIVITGLIYGEGPDDVPTHWVVVGALVLAVSGSKFKARSSKGENMKLKWICGLFLTAAIASPAVAQISVYIGSAPPPIRYETRGEAPGPGYAWVDGYWQPNGRHYQWVTGRWDQPPYEGAYWSHPHYDHYRQGWQMHEGHWDREDHDRIAGTTTITTITIIDR